MNMTLRQSVLTIFVVCTTVFINSAHADTQKLIIESGDNAQSRQRAQMEKDQWRDNSTLRKKMNQRAEKEWDKKDTAIDVGEACKISDNIYAYWEPETRRCLDLRTGRAIAP